MDRNSSPAAPAPPATPEAASATPYGPLWAWTALAALNVWLTTGLSFLAWGADHDSLYDRLRLHLGDRMDAPSRLFLGGALPVVFVTGLLALAGCWACLYRYFALALLPSLTGGDATPGDGRRRRAAAVALQRAFLLLIVAALCRLAPDMLAHGLETLPRPALTVPAGPGPYPNY